MCYINVIAVTGVVEPSPISRKMRHGFAKKKKKRKKREPYVRRIVRDITAEVGGTIRRGDLLLSRSVLDAIAAE